MDFRLYDNALGRFFGIDLLADMFTDQSPYHFAYNNPIAFADPSGLQPSPGIYQIDYDDLGDGRMFITFSYFNGDDTESIGYIASVVGGSEPFTMKEFAVGYGPGGSGYGGGSSSGSSSGSGSGSGGGGGSGSGGSGAGSGNSGPREASNVNLGEINQDIGAYGLANGIKTELIDIAAKSGTITQSTKNYVNTFKVLGKGLGVASAGISVYGGLKYYADGGQDVEVGIKAGLDTTMALIGAFGGPIGFGISGAYFILDYATDGFGGYGAYY